MKKAKVYLSTFVIYLVTAVVFAGAAIIINLSLSDAHSNLYVAKELAMDIGHVLEAQRIRADATESHEVETKEEIPATPNPKSFLCEINKQNKTISAYLKAKGENASYESRKKLALAHGMENYTGKVKENEQLLEMIRQEDFHANHCSQ